MRNIYSSLGWRLTKIKIAIHNEDPSDADERRLYISGYLWEISQLCTVNNIDMTEYLSHHGLRIERQGERSELIVE